MFTLLAMSLDNINWVSQRLAREGHLTPQDMAALEERLPIAFQERDLSRQQGRRGQGLKAKQWTERSRLKSAHLKYRDVFYKRPYVFLQFILAVGIRVCSTCNIQNILNSLKHSYPTTLASHDRQRIEDVARAQGIGQHPLFLEWMNILFESTSFMIAMFDYL